MVLGSLSVYSSCTVLGFLMKLPLKKVMKVTVIILTVNIVALAHSVCLISGISNWNSPCLGI